MKWNGLVEKSSSTGLLHDGCHFHVLFSFVPIHIGLFFIASPFSLVRICFHSFMFILTQCTGLSIIRALVFTCLHSFLPVQAAEQFIFIFIFNTLTLITASDLLQYLILQCLFLTQGIQLRWFGY